MGAKKKIHAGKNLAWLISKTKTNPNALAEKTGVPQPTIHRILSGESSDPRTGSLQPLADFFGVSVSDLRDRDLERDGTNLEDGPSFKNHREYPVISWVQAGEWTELSDNFQPGDAEDWRPCHKDLGKHGYVLRVKGKSMTAVPGEPYSFPEGILLYVNPDLEPVASKFVIVRRNRTKEATFKRLVTVDGELYLEALNPDWPNRYLKLEDGDHFCGVVMHAGFDMP